MKWDSRASGMLAAGLLLLGVAGCQENNDRTANIVSGKLPEGQRMPTNEERMKEAMKNRGMSLQKNDLKKLGYPMR